MSYFRSMIRDAKPSYKLPTNGQRKATVSQFRQTSVEANKSPHDGLEALTVGKPSLLGNTSPEGRKSLDDLATSAIKADTESSINNEIGHQSNRLEAEIISPITETLTNQIENPGGGASTFKLEESAKNAKPINPLFRPNTTEKNSRSEIEVLIEGENLKLPNHQPEALITEFELEGGNNLNTENTYLIDALQSSQSAGIVDHKNAMDFELENSKVKNNNSKKLEPIHSISVPVKKSGVVPNNYEAQSVRDLNSELIFKGGYPNQSKQVSQDSNQHKKPSSIKNMEIPTKYFKDQVEHAVKDESLDTTSLPNLTMNNNSIKNKIVYDKNNGAKSNVLVRDSFLEKIITNPDTIANTGDSYRHVNSKSFNAEKQALQSRQFNEQILSTQNQNILGELKSKKQSLNKENEKSIQNLASYSKKLNEVSSSIEVTKSSKQARAKTVPSAAHYINQQRDQSRANANNLPKVKIGHVDVFVQSSSPTKHTREKSNNTSSLSNPHYLRSL